MSMLQAVVCNETSNPTQYEVTPIGCRCSKRWHAECQGRSDRRLATLAVNATDIKAAGNTIAFVDSGDLWVRDRVNGTGYNETSNPTQYTVS